jgi:hypothetical protein
MTQEEHRRGSAAVALRRLSHPRRDGRDPGAVVEHDQISEVTRRLSELLAVVEHRPTEDRVRGAASTETIAPSNSGATRCAAGRPASAWTGDEAGEPRGYVTAITQKSAGSCNLEPRLLAGGRPK